MFIVVAAVPEVAVLMASYQRSYLIAARLVRPKLMR